MDWLRDFKWTIRHIEKTTTITDKSEKNKINTNFEKRLKTNGTIKDTEIKLQLRPVHPPIKQKTRLIPYQLQWYVEKELYNLLQCGHLEKVQNVDEDCSVSPAIKTVKKDKSVEIA